MSLFKSDLIPKTFVVLIGRKPVNIYTWEAGASEFDVKQISLNTPLLIQLLINLLSNQFLLLPSAKNEQLRWKKKVMDCHRASGRPAQTFRWNINVCVKTLFYSPLRNPTCLGEINKCTWFYKSWASFPHSHRQFPASACDFLPRRPFCHSFQHIFTSESHCSPLSSQIST